MKGFLAIAGSLLAIASATSQASQASQARQASQASQERTDPWSDDFFGPAIVGSWTGTGTVYGNDVELTRTWKRDLANHFLTADMHVRMSGGGFRALAYWRLLGPSRYEITWMDETGESQTFEAVSDPASKVVTTYYVEESEAGAEWRRLVYRILDEKHYEELMYRESGDGWEQLAEFKFQR